MGGRGHQFGICGWENFEIVLPDDDDIYHCAVMNGLWIKVDWVLPQPRPRLLTVLRDWKII